MILYFIWNNTSVVVHSHHSHDAKFETSDLL